MVKYRAIPRKVLYCDHLLRPRTNEVRTDKVNGIQTLTDHDVQVFEDVISGNITEMDTKYIYIERSSFMFRHRRNKTEVSDCPGYPEPTLENPAYGSLADNSR